MSNNSRDFKSWGAMFEGISEEWKSFLQTPQLDAIMPELEECKTLEPKLKDIFNFARYTPLEKIRVVILDKWLISNPGDNHGMAFSCVHSVPPTVEVILRCLIQQKYMSIMPNQGRLTKWARQGVLLLNTTLTLDLDHRDHSYLWKEYTQDLITRIDSIYAPIFILWGVTLQKIEDLIFNGCVLKWAYPYSLRDFTGCPNFAECNEILSSKGMPPVIWDLFATVDYDAIKPTLEYTMSHVVEPAVGLNENSYVFDTMSRIPSVVESVVEFVNANYHVFDTYDTIAFTDGSCNPNDGSENARGGYGVIFAYGPPIGRVIIGSVSNKKYNATNNRAEGMAIYRALCEISKYPNMTSQIVTDSKLWVKLINEYMPTWPRERFNMKKNPDLTWKIWQKYSSMEAVSITHIRAHGRSGYKSADEQSKKYVSGRLNDYVDELATYARENIAPGKYECI